MFLHENMYWNWSGFMTENIRRNIPDKRVIASVMYPAFSTQIITYFRKSLIYLLRCKKWFQICDLRFFVTNDTNATMNPWRILLLMMRKMHDSSKFEELRNNFRKKWFDNVLMTDPSVFVVAVFTILFSVFAKS